MNSEIRRAAAELRNCAEALEHLCEYLDSELAPSDLQRLRRHIERCATCQEAMASEQSLRVVLRRSCAEVAPDSLRMRVLSQIAVRRRTTGGTIEPLG